jgi:hypothetical protein
LNNPVGHVIGTSYRRDDANIVAHAYRTIRPEITEETYGAPPSSPVLPLVLATL